MNPMKSKVLDDVLNKLVKIGQKSVKKSESMLKSINIKDEMIKIAAKQVVLDPIEKRLRTGYFSSVSKEATQFTSLPPKPEEEEKKKKQRFPGSAMSKYPSGSEQTTPYVGEQHGGDQTPASSTLASLKRTAIPTCSKCGGTMQKSTDATTGKTQFYCPACDQLSQTFQAHVHPRFNKYAEKKALSEIIDQLKQEDRIFIDLRDITMMLNQKGQQSSFDIENLCKTLADNGITLMKLAEEDLGQRPEEKKEIIIKHLEKEYQKGDKSLLTKLIQMVLGKPHDSQMILGKPHDSQMILGKPYDSQMILKFLTEHDIDEDIKTEIKNALDIYKRNPMAALEDIVEALFHLGLDIVIAFATFILTYMSTSQIMHFYHVIFGEYNNKITKMAEAEIPGNRPEGELDKEFDPEQVREGIRIEMEHEDTINAFRNQIEQGNDLTNEQVAEMIAHDHLTEDPQYYTKLIEMEKGASLNITAKSVDQIKSDIESARESRSYNIERLQEKGLTDAEKDRYEKAKRKWEKEIDRLDRELSRAMKQERKKERDEEKKEKEEQQQEQQQTVASVDNTMVVIAQEPITEPSFETEKYLGPAEYQELQRLIDLRQKSWDTIADREARNIEEGLTPYTNIDYNEVEVINSQIKQYQELAKSRKGGEQLPEVPATEEAMPEGLPPMPEGAPGGPEEGVLTKRPEALPEYASKGVGMKKESVTRPDFPPICKNCKNLIVPAGYQELTFMDHKVRPVCSIADEKKGIGFLFSFTRSCKSYDPILKEVTQETQTPGQTIFHELEYNKKEQPILKKEGKYEKVKPISIEKTESQKESEKSDIERGKKICEKCVSQGYFAPIGTVHPAHDFHTLWHIPFTEVAHNSKGVCLPKNNLSLQSRPDSGENQFFSTKNRLISEEIK